MKKKKLKNGTNIKSNKCHTPEFSCGKVLTLPNNCYKKIAPKMTKIKK